LLAAKLTERWARQVIVDNRTGASGVIAMELLAQASPDGYTLYSGGGPLVTATVLKKVPFDVRKAYAPVVETTQQAYVLLVNGGVPANSVKDLIALATAKPGALNYGSTGVGASSHLTAEIFKYKAGVNIVHVPYKGTAQLMPELLNGQVQIVFTSVISGMPYVKSGKLRALGATTLKRLPAQPDLPTIAESGLPGFEVISSDGLFAPARLPTGLGLALSREVSQIMNSSELRDKLAAVGADPAPPNSPAEYRAKVEKEIDLWERFFRDTGLDPVTWR
jgi:tripartite-type tricarboxylate transporter receptor subunit TctC